MPFRLRWGHILLPIADGNALAAIVSSIPTHGSDVSAHLRGAPGAENRNHGPRQDETPSEYAGEPIRKEAQTMKTRTGNLFKRNGTYYVRWRVNKKLFMDRPASATSRRPGPSATRSSRRSWPVGRSTCSATSPPALRAARSSSNKLSFAYGTGKWGHMQTMARATSRGVSRLAECLDPAARVCNTAHQGVSLQESRSMS